MHKFKLFLLTLLISMFFILPSFGAESSIEANVYINGEKIVTAESAVFFLKFKDVQVLDKAVTGEAANMDLFGKILFKDKNEGLDGKFDKKELFTASYETISGEVSTRITFTDCLLYKVDKEKYLVIYRFKARNIK